MFNCDICGKRIKNGGDAYATTNGSMEKSVDGFMQSDMAGWNTISCYSCWTKVVAYIDSIRQE
jgi:hypothetical protein